MKTSEFYAKPPEVISCPKKGSPKNHYRVLKSFCLGYCGHRKDCEIQRGKRRT